MGYWLYTADVYISGMNKQLLKCYKTAELQNIDWTGFQNLTASV